MLDSKQKRPMQQGDISTWSLAHVAAIPENPVAFSPIITAADATPILPGLDIWDMWPLALRDGVNAAVAGGVLWFALSAPIQPDPIDRHKFARIRLILQKNGHWHDCGNAFPDGFAPGSRDWSGSAIYDFITSKVTIFFTAAGRYGEVKPTVEQRLFHTSGRLDLSGALPAIVGWQTPRELVQSDNAHYVLVNQAEGEPGKIKAFRDPAYFRDPADGQHYIVFAASLKNSPHAENAAIGIARALDDDLSAWQLLPPLLHADGVTNEMERPHLVHKNGQYYLFWSTLATVFSKAAPAGLTGLYGMVAPSLFGPYEPLNGSGLVIANPISEPLQTYSWWVMGDLSVTSFVDYWGLQGRVVAEHPDLIRGHFGGVPAPFLAITLHGSTSHLVTR